jgi:hypothetical protein
VTNPLRARPHPHLLEIPARPWLRRLSDVAGRPIGLDDVPDAELDSLRSRGYDAIWLMGVWRTGPRARRLALTYPDLLRAYEWMVPDWETRDVGGSPYSVQAYEPAEIVGPREALVRFRRRLHDHGLGLVLDFVPNHVGIDHEWLDQEPERLVRGTARDLGREPGHWFVHETDAGEERIFAHGRDPHFPGWTDTAQIDFRRKESRRAVRDVLRDVGSLADGLRCDMAMLPLPDVFEKTWGAAAADEAGDFWAEAVPALRDAFPEIVLIAEVYWGLESRLLDAGFDWVYDKETYDALVAGNVGALRDRMALSAPLHASRLRFLENHDEPRAREVFGERYRAAAVCAYALPGVRFFQDGQEDGRRLRAPVQLGRAPVEPADEECRAFYGHLLRFLDAAVLHHGAWAAAEVGAAANGGETPPLVANVWTGVAETRVLVANLGGGAASGTLRWPAPSGARAPTFVDAPSGALFESSLLEAARVSLSVEVPPFGALLLESRG